MNPKDENLELWSLTVENGLTPKTERYNREFLVKKEDKFKAVSNNEFIYNPMNMTLGAVDLNLTGKKVAVSGYYITMKTKENYDNNYFGVWLKTPLAIKMYKLYATGSLVERQRVQFPTLSQIKTLVPSLEEQKKIGALFKQLDDTITLHQQEITVLKQTKQAFLQKMFPKEGKSVPEVRFPGFTGEWELRKIREIGDLSAGGDINKSKLVDNEKYPVLANALTNDGIVGYYDEYKIEAPAVTITGRGDVGHAKARHINFTPVVRLLVLKADGFDVDFLENCINTRNIFVESTGVPQLTVPQLGTYEISFPSFREQTKIGRFFKQLDDTISLHQSEIEALQKTKKAFLQKMFV
ncbi:Type Ic restriction-modification system, HsdS subunit [Bacillus thuringiensis serovar tochigiensis BGSC 4Y1]|nr:Type Ic restriction-modification system, HsdS subunit [Bacillus thuringiensis serovar tochigiensis BGSC 4Y1]